MVASGEDADARYNIYIYIYLYIYIPIHCDGINVAEESSHSGSCVALPLLIAKILSPQAAIKCSGI